MFPEHRNQNSNYLIPFRATVIIVLKSLSVSCIVILSFILYSLRVVQTQHLLVFHVRNMSVTHGGGILSALLYYSMRQHGLVIYNATFRAKIYIHPYIRQVYVCVHHLDKFSSQRSSQLYSGESQFVAFGLSKRQEENFSVFC